MTHTEDSSYIEPTILHLRDDPPNGINPTHDEIARLAYELWQKDRNPSKSPDDFWFEAEHRLHDQAVLMSY
jgi:hypothetical protein